MPLLEKSTEDKTMQGLFSNIDTKSFITKKVFILQEWLTPFWFKNFTSFKMICITLL